MFHRTNKYRNRRRIKKGLKKRKRKIRQNWKKDCKIGESFQRTVANKWEINEKIRKDEKNVKEERKRYKTKSWKQNIKVRRRLIEINWRVWKYLNEIN